MENNNNSSNQEAAANTGVGTMENLANWVGAAVISAFFSSLDRFSCINITTTDPDDEEDEDDDDDEANDRPHALSSNSHDVSNLPV